MWLIVAIVVVVTIIVIVSNSKDKHSKFEKIRDKTLSDLKSDGSNVKMTYYGKNVALYTKENIPTLYVLNEKNELTEYSLEDISRVADYGRLVELFKHDVQIDTLWVVKDRISLPEVPVFGEYSKPDSFESVSSLIQFAGVDVEKVSWTHEVKYEGGAVSLNFTKGYFSFDSTDSIYSIDAVDAFNWNVGQEQHIYTTKKGRSGAGGAIVGGLTFGVVGAIAGGLARRKGAEIVEGNAYIDSAFIDLVVNDVPHRLWFVSKETENYEKKVDQLYKLADLMEKLLPEVEEEHPVETDNSANVSSNFSDLRELKSLLDDGIITQDDFDRKKAELLG